MTDESLLDFSRSAADALRSALPLAEFLRSRGLPEAAEAVSRGEPLHKSLSKPFPPVFLSMVRAGEESGKLDAFLDRYSEALETRIDFRRRMRRALTYPAFALLLAVCLLVLFAVKGLPLLLEPLMQAGAALPPGAVRVLAAGQWVAANWMILLGGTVGGFVILREILGSGPIRRVRAVAGHWLPGARYASEEARWCDFEATLGLLLGAGLRPREIMEILAQCAAEDPVDRRRLERGAALLPGGASFFDCLGACIPDEDRSRFVTAETAGRLDETLRKLAAFHREQHLHRLKTVTTAIQLGALVALAPAVFGLVMWIVVPAISAVGAAAMQAPSLDSGESNAPKIEHAAKFDAASARTSRFNENQAKSLVGFMQEHAVPEKSGETADGEKPAKKNPMPKLKPMQGMKGTQFKRIEPTAIKSGLE